MHFGIKLCVLSLAPISVLWHGQRTLFNVVLEFEDASPRYNLAATHILVPQRRSDLFRHQSRSRTFKRIKHSC